MRPELRDALVNRRRLHKMFDLLKGEEALTLFDNGPNKQYRYLLMRDCYLPMEMVADIELLRSKIDELMQILVRYRTIL